MAKRPTPARPAPSRLAAPPFAAPVAPIATRFPPELDLSSPAGKAAKRKIRESLPDGPLRVRALRLGLYGNRRQRAGTVFVIRSRDEFARWMEFAPRAAVTPVGERLTAENVAKRMPATPAIDVPANERADDGELETEPVDADEAFETPPSSSPEDEK